MRPLPHRKVERTLRRHGFRLQRLKGSHGKWVHPDGRRTIVPRHARDIPRGTMRVIAKQAGIPLKAFR